MTSHRTTTDSIEPINVEPHVANTNTAPFIVREHLRRWTGRDFRAPRIPPRSIAASTVL